MDLNIIKTHRLSKFKRLDLVDVSFDDYGRLRLRRPQSYFTPNGIALTDLPAGEFAAVDFEGGIYEVRAFVWPWPKSQNNLGDHSHGSHPN